MAIREEPKQHTNRLIAIAEITNDHLKQRTKEASTNSSGRNLTIRVHGATQSKGEQARPAFRRACDKSNCHSEP